MRKMTEFDPMTGIVTTYDYSYSDDVLVTERIQDVEPIIEDNKRIMREVKPGKDFRLAASIPNIVIEQWLKEGINVYKREDWPAVRRRLNDPEYQYLRTWHGKL